MQRTPVRSSNVASVGYDPNTQTLEVEFHSGDVYQYFGVAEAHFVRLTAGSVSVGSYLNREVKPRYRYRRIR